MTPYQYRLEGIYHQQNQDVERPLKEWSESLKNKLNLGRKIKKKKAITALIYKKRV